MTLPVLKPMRPTDQPSLVLSDGWSVEPKLAGARAMVYVDDRLWVRTGHGRNITALLPELDGIAEQLPEGTIVDGELVAGQAKPRSFSRVARRLPFRSRASPVTFRAFDLLAVNNVLLTDRPYRTRRGLLEKLRFEGPSWRTAMSFSEAGVDAIRTCMAAGFEGLVRTACVEAGLESLALKHLDSPYEPGRRSRRWLRIALSPKDGSGHQQQLPESAPDELAIIIAEAFGRSED